MRQIHECPPPWGTDMLLEQTNEDTPFMQSINRAAIYVRPKQPFFDWAKSLEGGLPEGESTWSSVYLADQDDGELPEAIIARHFFEIFDEQLEAWHTLESDWPKARTLTMFQQWFECEVIDLVLDLSRQPIEHD